MDGFCSTVYKQTHGARVTQVTSLLIMLNGLLLVSVTLAGDPVLWLNEAASIALLRFPRGLGYSLLVG